MLTRCNHCETCFQINERLVRENDATVACGECANVFDARLNLVDEYSGEYYQLAEDVAEPVHPPEWVTAEDHEAATAALPLEIDNDQSPASVWPSEPDTQQRDPAPLIDELGGLEVPYTERVNRVHDDREDPHFQQFEPAPTVPVADNTRAREAAHDLPAIYLEDYPALANDLLERKQVEHMPASSAEVSIATDADSEQASRSSFARRASWVLSIGLLLTGIVVAAIGYRDWIAQSSLPRPARAVFCTIVGCQLPARQALDQLTVVNKTTYTHPTVEGALIVTVDLLNSADFAQPYPSLQVIMADENGRTVAQRDFTSQDYLSAEFNDQLLVPGEPVRINLEVVDPGPSAKSFEIGLH